MVAVAGPQIGGKTSHASFCAAALPPAWAAAPPFVLAERACLGPRSTLKGRPAEGSFSAIGGKRLDSTAAPHDLDRREAANAVAMAMAHPQASREGLPA
mmetsp:Transcript_43948/g.103994  ORF Transcript_43948/g.103994 Transcript_43948/m.103994 type:complete len:99 (+) Transcript_43948:604-900(+)